MMELEELRTKRIGIIYGGLSSEREVSIRSAENVFKALQEKGYDSVMIDLDENISENVKKEKIDLDYIILHGSPGEDGTIQGLFDIIKIPYTGSGVLGSALALNKIVSKQLFIANDIPTPRFSIINKEINWNELKELGFPLIFKPCSEGSSIGVEKYDSLEKMKEKLPELVKQYRKGIVEQFLDGVNITIGVLDEDKGPIALPALELVPKNEFYDYEAKYTKGMTEFIIPARLDDRTTEKAMRLAVRAHQCLWCYGVSRVDMIVMKDGIFVLEVNTLPGMTEMSDLPAEALAMGIKFPDLVEKILISGMNRYE